jgi:hypothetical protein
MAAARLLPAVLQLHHRSAESPELTFGLPTFQTDTRRHYRSTAATDDASLRVDGRNRLSCLGLPSAWLERFAHSSSSSSVAAANRLHEAKVSGLLSGSSSVLNMHA